MIKIVFFQFETIYLETSWVKLSPFRYEGRNIFIALKECFKCLADLRRLMYSKGKRTVGFKPAPGIFSHILIHVSDIRNECPNLGVYALF